MDCPLQDSVLRIHYKGMLPDEGGKVFSTREMEGRHLSLPLVRVWYVVMFVPFWSHTNINKLLQVSLSFRCKGPKCSAE